MTENEAIKRCDMLINGMSINNATNRAFEEDGKDYPTFATMKVFAQTCRNALEEIQQYRAIGTIEEFKALKDKSEPKKPNQVSKAMDKDKFVGLIGRCPNCGSIVAEDNFVCEDCFQVLDWSE